MVIQIDLQRIHCAPPLGILDFLCGICQHHLQLGVFCRQLEPIAAGRQYLRVELDGGGVHAQLFGAKLGQ